MYYLIFFSQILVFYLTSKKVTSGVYGALSKYFSKKNSLRLFALIFLPGTFMHEFSHYIMASVLFVPAGKFNLSPKYEHEGIQMGSVSIARTDPLRRFVIGIAPVIIGIFVVLLLSSMIKTTEVYWQKGVLALFIFTIANSMFSSRKDMEGAIKLFLTIFVLVLALYIMGVDVRINIPESVLFTFDEYVKISVRWFLFPLIMNIIFVGISELT